jgi:hypothetical protein
LLGVVVESDSTVSAIMKIRGADAKNVVPVEYTRGDVMENILNGWCVMLEVFA